VGRYPPKGRYPPRETDDPAGPGADWQPGKTADLSPLASLVPRWHKSVTGWKSPPARMWPSG